MTSSGVQIKKSMAFLPFVSGDKVTDNKKRERYELHTLPFVFTFQQQSRKQEETNWTSFSFSPIGKREENTILFCHSLI